MTLDTILNATASECGLRKDVIINSGKKLAATARKVICYNAYSVGLRPKDIAAELGISFGIVYKSIIGAKVKIERNDLNFMWHLNASRKKLHLDAIKGGVVSKKKKKEPPTRLAKFSVSEENAIEAACLESIAYMKDYGKGDAPLKPGYARTRQS